MLWEWKVFIISKGRLAHTELIRAVDWFSFLYLISYELLYISCFFLVLLVLLYLLDNIKCKLKSRSRGAKGPDPMAFMHARYIPVEINSQHPLLTLIIFPAVCWVQIFTAFPDFHNTCMSARNKRENGFFIYFQNLSLW